jgi:indolepyruvate ferredoxin oxidoreductase alpha subunit
MGASVGMAVGASEAGAFPVFAVLGDSTFTHTGVNGLVTAVKQNANVNVVILDNDTTGMTGGQESSLVGEGLIKLVRGTGMDEKHVKILNPLPKNRSDNARIISEEISHQGPSVIVFQRPCIQIKKN